MSSEGNITLASNVLGTIGTVLWCIQLLPQIWFNWHKKSTEGLPATMMFLWASCSVPMGTYMILQIQPHIVGLLSIASWGQILHYSHHYGKLKTVLICSGLLLLLGGLETMLILTLRCQIPYRNDVTWPNTVVGVIGAILLIAGLLPPYFELWKRNGRVIGLNWVFLVIDTLGGIFSLFALGLMRPFRASWAQIELTQHLAAQGTFDILGGTIYILVVVLEGGIYISHITWRIRYRSLRKEAKQTGKSIDDLLVLTLGHSPETQDVEQGMPYDHSSSESIPRLIERQEKE
ncbi:PQ loop repeat protein [Penicillium canescens]|uniref:PQ loop repeat protein n=1 Tax=Penicillium canescens TaxID=5083 RepID=A0AAD6N8D7_PENCN|nr:PQ loop repeat protein [Penicillium canescens]KAJ6041371.1 PQ loop repeat protein [Penicillium canescens]KAJ6050632.1 PQ loop repeat protein [Penicillium canescens]KAJ6065855.1 PQ loop repeat protein [Penicillium canescens]